MQTTSLVFPGARDLFFSSREEFLAYRSAWKSLACKRQPLRPSVYAVHALVCGKNLYRTFSPNFRPSQGDPYRTLVAALTGSRYLERGAQPAAGLSDDEYLCLTNVWSKADRVLQPCKSSYSQQSQIARGQGEFSAPAGRVSTQAA